MTRVLVTNVYSARNAGDAAIVLGMIDCLRRTPGFEDAEIALSSADHRGDAAAYPVPVEPSFHSLKDACRGGPRLRCLYFLKVLAPLSLLWAGAWRLARWDLPVPRGLRRLLRCYARSDLVIAAGGGYLYTTSRLHGNVMLLIHLHSFRLAALLGKPVYLWAQSIGPFAAGYQARMVRLALRAVRLVEVREDLSRDLVAGWELKVPVREAADAAFLLPAAEPDADLGLATRGDSPRVGMTVRRWFRDPAQQLDYQRTMAAFADRLVQEYNAEVVFVPQVTAVRQHDDDRRAAREVAGLMTRTDRARVIEDELSAPQVKWLCGRMDLFVGTRMHSNIFALSLGVPTLAISYQPKTDGIMAQLGLGAFVLPITGLSPGHLWQAFDHLRESAGEVREKLRRVIPEQTARAEVAGRLIADDFATPARERA